MAPIFKPLALACALFAAISSAAPVRLNKREDVVVWETVTTVVWTTIDVTTTIYPTQPPAIPTPIVPTTSAEPTSTTAPAPEQPKPTEASAQPETTEPQPTQPAPTVVPTIVPTPVAAPVVQPAPEEPAPQPATTAAPPTSTTQAAQPTAPAASSGSTDTTPSSGYSGSCSKDAPCVGQVTYYDTATSASAPSSCGMTNDGFTENVLALPVGIMTDADCGKTVTVTYNGVTTTGTVVDKCMGCDNTSIDLSRHFFGELADMGAGRLNGVSWYIN